ncbi:MAG: KTSC domain-containing protein [bacterium]
MQRTEVKSSSVVSIGYDPRALILEVEFRSGRIYRYFDVSEYTHQMLMNAPSHGGFLTDNIRYTHRYQRVV